MKTQNDTKEKGGINYMLPILGTLSTFNKTFSVPLKFRTVFTLIFSLLASTCFAVIEITQTVNTCAQTCDGGITVRAKGSAGPFTASIVGQPEPDIFGPDQAGYTYFFFNDLCVGDYTIKVVNAYMCEVNLTTQVGVAESDAITETDEADIVCICPGGYGSIAPVIEGAVSYEWNGPEGFSSDLPTIDLLENPGQYNLTATDEEGCTKSFAWTIGNCIAEEISEYTLMHSCDGPGTGSILVELEAVAAPVAFYWTYTPPGENNSSPFTGVTNDNLSSFADNLHEGEYCLEYFTANGCTFQECWEISENQGIEEISGFVKPSNAIIELRDGQGNPLGNEYIYSWTGPGNFTSSDPSFTAPESGTYIATISYPASQNNPCTKEVIVEYLSCSDLEAISSSSSPDFPLSTEVFVEGTNKFIDLTVSGLDNYYLTYTWFTPANGTIIGFNEDIRIKRAGEYCVNVTEVTCNVTFTICETVCDFGVKIYPFELDDECDGVELFAYVLNGTSGPYSFSWDDESNSTTNSIIADYHREYCVTITNGADCSMTSCLSIPYPNNLLTVSATATNAEFGNNNGSINLNVTGGWTPYTYDWDTQGLSGPNATGLSGGYYNVTVTDDCGSQETLSVHIDCIIPEQIVLDCLNDGVTPVSCGSSLGSILIDEECLNTAVGSSFPTSTPEYTYMWDNGSTSSYLQNLAVGEYCVTILEENSNCSVAVCIDVPQENEAAFDLSVSVLQHTCYGGNNAILQVNVDGGTPGAEYTYEWSTLETSYPFPNSVPFGNTQVVTGVSAGWYSVIVTDTQTGCEGSISYLYWSSGPSLSINSIINPDPNCDASPTTLSAITSGGSGNYSYEWYSCCPLTPINGVGNSATVLEAGTYYVTVTDNISGCIGSEAFSVEHSSLILIERDMMTGDCGQGGEMSLSVSGGIPPYTYLWSNGSTTSTADGLPAGENCVTVTDAVGCINDECFIIEAITPDIEIAESIRDDCGNECSGSIEITLDDYDSVESIEWTGDGTPVSTPNGSLGMIDLCSGTYTVTIQLRNGCVVEETFVVGGTPEFTEDDYIVEIVSPFDPDSNFGSAEVRVYSEFFMVGDEATLVGTDVTSPIYTNAFAPFAVFYIPLDYMNTLGNYTDFDFEISNGECTYEGEIIGILSCRESDSTIFSIDLVEDPNLPCGSVSAYSYKVDISPEINPPYTIEVYMHDAYLDSDQDYTQTIEYNSNQGEDFIVEGIPPGVVIFKITDFCNNEYFHEGLNGASFNSNCCGFLCEIEDSNHSTTNNENGGTWVYDIPGFTVSAVEQCFDGDCVFFDECSHVRVSVDNELNCWTGEITFEFPGDDSYPNPNNTLVYEIGENSNYTHISGEHRWFPNSLGDYFMNVKYRGTGDFEGDDCDLNDILLRWYGDESTTDIIGFNNQFWFDPNSVAGISIPEEFIGAYFGAWQCEDCGGGVPYLYENNQEECDGFGNWQFTYFEYEPANLQHPCSGGKIRIIGYDENGFATVMDELIFTANPIAELPGAQPFGLPVSQYCNLSGWCLFEALDIYTGYSSILPNNIPIIASWSDPESCESWPEDPETDPQCEGEGEDSDCPFGQICINGLCYTECVEGEDCFSGTCQQLGEYWVCVEGPDPCNGFCADDEICVDGECLIPTPCGFNVTVSGGGENTYVFDHNLPLQSTITLTYDTYHREDEIIVSGGASGNNIGCIATWDIEEGLSLNQTFTIVSTTDPIVIQVIPCETSSTYFLEITCSDGFNSNSPVSQNAIDDSGNNSIATDETRIAVRPNPFQNNFALELISARQGEVNIEIVNLFGKNFFNQKAQVIRGTNLFNYNLDIPVGVYQIVVTDENGKRTTEKIVKVNY